jgi:hypothetical protein
MANLSPSPLGAGVAAHHLARYGLGGFTSDLPPRLPSYWLHLIHALILGC